ncbi:MAG: M48 family peptidase [Candidatus Cloacimonadota bacterium]|nr:MAG: M48 family peptidase [Candidatus Cloacimonadota bacterium]
MEFSNIPYRVSHRAVKYPRLEFKTGELLIVLPFGHKPDVLLNKHRSWILKKLDFIEGCLERAKDKELIDRTEERFKELVYSLVTKTSKDLGVELNHIYFRKMRTKWASLSSVKNLTVNRLMKYLPEYLIRYVVFHEIAHLIEKRHNDKFWQIISRKYEGYRKMEREMFAYWFLVSKEYSQI